MEPTAPGAAAEDEPSGGLTHTLALGGILGISFSAIFVRQAGVSPGTAAFFRAAYALPLLFLVWLLGRKADPRTPSARLLAAGAGLFLAVDLTLWHHSIDLIGAGLATVLANTQVAFVGVIAWLLYREQPTRLSLLTIPVVFAGVALISGLGRDDAFGDDPLGGMLYGLGSGLSYAGFLLVFRASNRGLAPPAGPLLDATAGTAIGTLALAPLDAGFSLSPAWPEHGWLLALALVCQVTGWLLIAVALPRLPALETSVLLLLQPMATVLWASIIFTERLSPLQWAGVALVLGGIAALSWRGSVERPATAPAEP
jgi:drug/metabolite transporter (DMT)-like permease